MGACVEPGNFRIVTERLSNDLETIIHGSTSNISLKQIAMWMKQTAQG